jgi:hypothetical protein
MNMPQTLSLTVLAVLVQCGAGCRKQASVDATKPLQESFQAAESEVQQVIAQVNTQLNAGQYAEATRTLSPLVSDHPLSEGQRQAVGVALHQINQSIAANPSLDTKEIYEMRARMFRAVHNPNKRF